MPTRRAATIMRQLLLGATLALFGVSAHAGCQSEMRILADDLADVQLSSAQRQWVADKILKARRHCWVHREEAAMELINAARRIAGLQEVSGEFDWENVPLDSLEGAPPK